MNGSTNSCSSVWLRIPHSFVRRFRVVKQGWDTILRFLNPRHGSRYPGPNLKPNFFDLGFSPPNQPTDTEIDKKPFFFAADEKTFFFFDEKTWKIFFSTKRRGKGFQRPFFSTKRPFSLRQVRKRHFFCGRTGSISVGVRFGVSDRTTGWPVRFGEATEPRYRNATETHT